MSPNKIRAMSIDDCDILYEKITSSNHGRNHGQSNTIDEVNENRDCTCKLNGSEYPNYAADEISLFHKLQAGVIPPSVDMKASLDETIDLEMEILDNDSPVNHPDPEKDSDSMDCEVLWAKYADFSNSEPKGDQSAKKSDVLKNSKVREQEITPKNYASPKSLKKNSDLGSISLSTSIYDISSYLEETKAESPKDAETENEEEIASAHNCQICKISLLTVYELKVHLLDHANGTKTNADIYRKSIIALQQLDHRVRTDRLRKRHCCVICQKVFLTRTDLRWHINLSHTQGRPYQCQLCPKNYTRKCHLTRHEATHWNQI